MELNGKNLAFETNQEFKYRVHERWPWLNIQQFHRDEQIRIVHEEVVDYTKITDAEQHKYEWYHPTYTLVDVPSWDELVAKVEESVLAILAGLNLEDKEALAGLKCYLGFADIAYCASDDGDEYEHYSTAIGLIRVIGDQVWTTMNGRAVPVKQEPDAAELARLQKVVDEQNRLYKVVAFANRAKEVLTPMRITITGGHHLRENVRNTIRLLSALDEVLAGTDEKGTYIRLTPTGIDYADTSSPVIQTVGFDTVALEITTESKPRQIVHLMAGDDNWDPTNEELQQLVELFLDANVVNGAIVSTAKGVKVREGVSAEIITVEPGTAVVAEVFVPDTKEREQKIEFIDLPHEDIVCLMQAVQPIMNGVWLDIGIAPITVCGVRFGTVHRVDVEHGRTHNEAGVPINNRVTVTYSD